MNKADLINAVAHKAAITKGQAADAVSEIRVANSVTKPLHTTERLIVRELVPMKAQVKPVQPSVPSMMISVPFPKPQRLAIALMVQGAT